MDSVDDTIKRVEGVDFEGIQSGIASLEKEPNLPVLKPVPIVIHRVRDLISDWGMPIIIGLNAAMLVLILLIVNSHTADAKSTHQLTQETANQVAGLKEYQGLITTASDEGLADYQEICTSENTIAGLAGVAQPDVCKLPYPFVNFSNLPAPTPNATGPIGPKKRIGQK
jgi:hypothetical protein